MRVGLCSPYFLLCALTHMYMLLGEGSRVECLVPSSSFRSRLSPRHPHHDDRHHPRRRQPAFLSSPSVTTPSSSRLHGKAWDGLQIAADSEEVQWYLLNCVAGLEIELLAQCREVARTYPDPSDMVRFSVPTRKEARSHGKRNVIDDIVLYPGYVFAKLRLCEDVYEELSAMPTCRSWMGTQRRRGHKRLPSVPLPLSDEEIASFHGLEENMDRERNATTDELLGGYAGFEVEGMVKVLKGKHTGEDGIVRRLKGGRIFVRLYTYGTQFDEWLLPEQLRPLTELELMRGLGGRETPIRQDDFDVSIGKDPVQMTPVEDGGYSKRNLRRGLTANVKGERTQRNRREDRQARGDGSTNPWGTSREQLRKDDDNWQKYQSKQIERDMAEENTTRQNRSNDSAAYDVDSQWGRGGDDRQQKQQQQNNKNEEDWSRFTSDTSKNPSSSSSKDDDFFNDLMSELSSTLGEDTSNSPMSARSSSLSDGSNTPADGNSEDDFFSSLMSELSSSGSSGDDAPPQAEDTNAVSSKKTNNDSEDDFFASLEREMATKDADVGKKGSNDATASEDDFFASLEQELTSTLDESVGSPAATPPSLSKDNDFFANLEQELTTSLGEPVMPSSPSPPPLSSDGDDFFASLERELSSGSEDLSSDDDFFAMLERDMSSSSSSVAVEKDLPSPQASSSKRGGGVDSRGSSTATSTDLSKLTVPILKGMLKERGLKVSGKKAELIDRLRG